MSYNFPSRWPHVFCNIILGCILLISVVARAQHMNNDAVFPLHGKVVNVDNVGLNGVTVTDLTRRQSLITDSKGEFTIMVNHGDSISISMIGYERQSFLVDSKGTEGVKTIILEQRSNVLKDVAVTALGIKREQRELGYAYSEVNGDDIIKAREPNFINSLAGRVPGLIITGTAGGPAGSSRVIIRGNTSVTGDNQPLYVIDGVPMDNSNYGQAGSGKYAEGYDMGDAVSAINPDDIEKVSVLKGPSAAALYGSSAANGVILITTKKGKSSKELGITFNSTTSVERQSTSYDGYQYLYGQGLNETLPQDATQSLNTLFTNFGPRLDPGLTYTGFDGQKRPYALVKNNINGFFRTGTTFTNNISIASSSKKSTVRFSASDMRLNDIVPKSGINRNTFDLSASTKLGKKLTADIKAFYLTENVNDRPAMADNPSNIGNSFIGLANNVDQAYFKTHYKDQYGQYLNWGGGQYHLNPYWVINEMYNLTKKDRLMGAISLNYKFNSWISLQGRVSTDLTHIDFENYTPVTTPGTLSGSLEVKNSKYLTNQADVLLTMERNITKNIALTARLGAQLYRSDRPVNDQIYLNQVVKDVISPNSYADKSVMATEYRKSKNSAYGLLTAAYKKYLYVDFTVRTDASSTLPVNNNVYTYPSLSGSFIFTDAFHMDKSVLSFGKLRVSAAEVGQDTDPYMLDIYYDLFPFTFQGNSLGYISTSTLPNKNLKPTRTKSFEVGTNLKFFKDRLVFDGTYYTSKSIDQINVVPAPISSGYSKQIINAGTITNKGIELSLSGDVIQHKDLNWHVSVNYARDKNMVLSLAEGVPYLSLADARWLGLSVVAQPGAPYGSFLGYGYQKTKDGQLILNPNTLTPLPTEERQILGKGTYDWTGGMQSALSYKNWTLSGLIDVKWGAEIFSSTNLMSVVQGTNVMTLPGRAEFSHSEELRLAAGMTPEQWRAAGKVQGYVPQGVVQTGVDGNPIYEKNTSAVDPSVYWPAFYSDGNGVAIPFIFDASYVKLRELTLGYAFSSKLLSRWGIKALSLSIVSRNPFYIYKKLPNIDPESNYQNGNGQGIEYGSLPSRRSFGMNLNLKF